MGKFEYIAKEKLIITEAVNSFPQTMKFFKNYLSVTARNKSRISLPLKPPFYFQVLVEEKANVYDISIYNFEDVSAPFTWKNISELPKITDALSDMYNLEFFTAKQINPTTEAIIFRSKIGRKTKQLCEIRDSKKELFIYVFDKFKTNLRFKWSDYQLIVNSQKKSNPEIIRLVAIEKIVIYIDKPKKERYFTGFAIEIFKINKDIVTLFETEFFMNSVDSPVLIRQIAAKLMFNAVMNLIDILKTKEELSDVEIELMF